MFNYQLRTYTTSFLGLELYVLLELIQDMYVVGYSYIQLLHLIS